MTKNFIPQNADHIKRLLRSYRIDQHIAMYTNKVFGVQDAVLVLEGRIAIQVRLGALAAAGRFGKPGK